MSIKIVCDQCGKQEDPNNEQFYITITYSTSVIVRDKENYNTVRDVKRIWHFCCDECFKKFFLEMANECQTMTY